MLTEICRELHNWFDFEQPKWQGEFTIQGGSLPAFEHTLQDGQYYYITGSVFNDGVHQFPTDDLHDETFTGKICAMVIPNDFLTLVAKITEWVNKNCDSSSVNMSPFSSESFGGYSYSKGNSGSGKNQSGVSWQSMFVSNLRPWRKI